MEEQTMPWVMGHRALMQQPTDLLENAFEICCHAGWSRSFKGDSVTSNAHGVRHKWLVCQPFCLGLISIITLSCVELKTRYALGQA